ncbi:MAG TPA: CHAT domain-containing protein [Blastocatellia bacterium]
MTADRTNSARVIDARTPSIWLLLALVIAPVVASSQSTPQDNRAAGLRLAAALLRIASNNRSQAQALLRQNPGLNTYAFRARIVYEADLECDRRGFARSLFLYDIAIQASRLSNDTNTLAACLYSMGNICGATGDLQKAEECYLESARISSQRNLPWFYLASLGTLADLYTARGEYEKAKEASEKRLSYSLSLGSDYGILPLDARLGALAALGKISEWQGDHGSALRLLRESLGVAQTLSQIDPDRETAVAERWSDLGWVYYSMGDYGGAMESYGRAFQLSQAIGYKQGLCEATLCLALVYLEQADYEKAEELSGEGLQIARELNDTETAAGALGNLGYAYQRQGDYPRAERYFTEAVGLARTLPDSGTTIQIIEGLGVLYQGKSQYQLALRYYSEALKSAESTHLGVEQFELTWRKADAYLAMADYDKVIELCDSLVKLDSEMAQPNFSYLALTTRGEAYLAKGEYALAAKDLSAAIEKAELMRGQIGGREVERVSFLERKLRPYQLIVDLLVAQKKPDEALAYSERAKGRALLDVLNTRRENINSVMSAAERQRDRDLSATLTALSKQVSAERLNKQADALAEAEGKLKNARVEYESFTDALYVAHPELKTQRVEPAAFDLHDLADIGAGGDTALVEFMVNDKSTHIFVVTWDPVMTGRKASAARVRSYDVSISRKDLADLTASFAERLGNRNIGKDAMARQLFDLLLAPGKESLAGKTTLAIIPDGPLWNVPFQALKQADGKYLIETHSIFYAPSITVLQQMVQKSESSTANSGQDRVANDSGVAGGLGTLLAFGNPALPGQTIERVRETHRDENLAPLPDAEAEVRQLAAMYQSRGAKVYTGADAREDRAKAEMGKYRILHFATHGILDSNNPMYSNIVLSTDDKSPDDGLLEAWEIMRLDLKADLAVLSACDTARGKTEGGEGVIGMSWAFFVAGCPTTVVSQWKVDSASTAQLMVEFHKNFLQNAQNPQMFWKKADALRRAMLTLMARPEYKDPYYWAGFVVVGAG